MLKTLSQLAMYLILIKINIRKPLMYPPWLEKILKINRNANCSGAKFKGFQGIFQLLKGSRLYSRVFKGNFKGQPKSRVFKGFRGFKGAVATLNMFNRTQLKCALNVLCHYDEYSIPFSSNMLCVCDFPVIFRNCLFTIRPS